MKPSKILKLENELIRLRKTPQNARAIQKLAKALGRTKVTRGKEPNWINLNFSTLPPVSIPDHGGKDLAIGTRSSILNQLEDDLTEWKMAAKEEPKKAKQWQKIRL
jgi:hypothetical protein